MRDFGQSLGIKLVSNEQNPGAAGMNVEAHTNEVSRNLTFYLSLDYIHAVNKFVFPRSVPEKKPCSYAAMQSKIKLRARKIPRDSSQLCERER